MELTLGAIAERIGARLVGDAAISISGVSGIREALPGQITFVANPRYAHYLAETRASAVIVGDGLGETPIPCLIATDPYRAYLEVLQIFSRPPDQPPTGIDPSAIVSPRAKLGENLAIGPYVVIEDDVEIGANAAIDCASVGETRIKRGVKIDNLVQIGHSCTIEEDALICGQVGMAGTSHVGKRVILAGQVGLAGHLSVGDDTVITAQSGVANSVEAGKLISGYPATENREWLRSSAAIRKLGDFVTRIRRLEKEVFKSEPPA